MGSSCKASPKATFEMGLKTEHDIDGEGSGRQGTQGWVLVLFLGSVVCVTVGGRGRGGIGSGEVLPGCGGL